MRNRLPRSVRVRVAVILGCGAVLLLTLLPVEIVAVRNGSPAGELVVGFGLGVGLPLLAVVAAWLVVRRYRADPERAELRPNEQSRRLLTAGRLAAALLALVVGLVSRHAWAGYATFVVLFVVVFAVARREDPRLHWFRRMDSTPRSDETD